MKTCPNCQRTFDDTMNFCQFDAAPLVSAASHDDLPPTVVGFQPPPTQAVSSGNQFNKPTHPQMPAFQTSPPAPQFQPNQPAPNFNPQFNPPGATAQPNQFSKKPGNRWAMAGLSFMIAACVLTFLSFVFGSFRGFGNGLGYGSVAGYNMKFSVLPVITIIVTLIALAFAALGFLMGIIKPDYYGRRNSAIAASLVSILLLGVQMISTAASYNEVSKVPSYNYNTTYNGGTTNTGRNSVSNTGMNRPANVPTAPVSLATAIIGTWRDNVGATITFYADKTLIINDKNGKKIADADYQITGSNKMAMLKNGVRIKEYDITVSGNRMTMDGEAMTKIY
jgi:uncharacterized membrane protein